MNVNKIIAATVLVTIGAGVIFIVVPEFIKFKDTFTCYSVHSNMNKKEYPEKLLQYCEKLVNAASKKVKEREAKEINDLIEKLDE